MSYQLIMHQTATDPAEYEPDNPWKCSRCRAELDADDDTQHETVDGPTCSLCLHHCRECGVILEGANAKSDLLLVDRLSYCEMCVSSLLVPDWEIVERRVIWR